MKTGSPPPPLFKIKVDIPIKFTTRKHLGSSKKALFTEFKFGNSDRLQTLFLILISSFCTIIKYRKGKWQ